MAHTFDAKKNFRVDTFVIKINLRWAIGFRYNKDGNFPHPFFIPTDNEIFGESVFQYPLGWQLDPFFSANCRTQITESYKLAGGKKVSTAKIWDPVVSTQTAGFIFSAKNGSLQFSQRIGVSAKQTRAKLHTLLTDDPKTQNIRERFRTESGIEAKTEFSSLITDRNTIISRLELFGTFKNLGKWVMRWALEIRCTIWENLSMISATEFIYDESQKIGLQYRHSTRLGFDFTLIR